MVLRFGMRRPVATHRYFPFSGGVSTVPASVADLVLLALYLGNDLGELLGRMQDFGGWGHAFWLPTLGQTREGEYRIEPPGRACSLWAELRHRLASNLRVWELASRTWARRCGDRTGGETLRNVTKLCPGCLQSLWQPWWLAGAEGRREESLRRLEWVLRRMQEEVRASGATLWVLLLPTKWAVEREEVRSQVEQAAPLMGLDLRTLWREETRVRHDVRRLLRRIGVIGLDAQPVLRAVHRRERKELYWRLDRHLNPEGHAAVARVVAPRLQVLLRRTRTNL